MLDVPLPQRQDALEVKTTIPATWADYEEQLDAEFKHHAWGRESAAMGIPQMPALDDEGFILPKRVVRRPPTPIMLKDEASNPFQPLVPPSSSPSERPPSVTCSSEPEELPPPSSTAQSCSEPLASPP